MSGPPSWLPLLVSSEFTLALFWQPQWMHRLFRRLANGFERLFQHFDKHPERNQK